MLSFGDPTINLQGKAIKLAQKSTCSAFLKAKTCGHRSNWQPHTRGLFIFFSPPFCNRSWSMNGSFLLRLFLPPCNSTHSLIKFHVNQITSCLWLAWSSLRVPRLYPVSEESWEQGGSSEVVGCGHCFLAINQNYVDWRVKTRVSEGCVWIKTFNS